MKGISVKQAAEAVGGRLSGSGDAGLELKGLVIDSRNVMPGFAFAAIVGKRADGHDYINKAFELGASCCFAERDIPGAPGCLIVVDSTAKAMARLAEAYRKMLDIPVIGITVLSQRFKVLKTDKNLNNELGVPLTIFRIEPEHEAAVIEMGISDFSEMSRLAQMARPTDAVFTLIGNAHLDRLHDRTGVFKAKTEMLEYMPCDGTVFLNADDDLLCACDCRQRKVLYGLGDNAGVRAENIRVESAAMQTCDIVSGERRLSVSIPAYGRHMVYAALEGAAVGMKFGLSDDEIIRGIASYETVGRRANVIDTGFITVIDDCYNANPDSVKCAIDSMCASRGRKVCILGDMLEMGTARAERHADIGRYAVSHGVELLLCVGEMSENTARAAEDIASLHFDSNAQLISALPALIKKGDTVLVKASHSMRLEEVSEALKLLK